MIVVRPGANSRLAQRHLGAIDRQFMRAGGSGQESKGHGQDGAAETYRKQKLRRRHAGRAAGQRDDVGADALPRRIGDHVIADGALHRARTGAAPRALDLLADHEQQMRGADDRGGNQNPRQIRQQHEPRAADDQQAGAHPGRDGIIAAVDEAPDRHADRDRQQRIDRGDDAEPDHRQIELDGAIGRGDADDGDDRLLDEGGGNDGEEQAAVHSG